MAVDFNSTHKAKDPLQDVDETVPGFIPDPSTYVGPTPGGKRRARTYSQVIADATRGIDAGMAMPSGGVTNDLGSQPGVGRAHPDWRGHYDAAQKVPTPRAALQLQTYPPSEIHPLTLEERVALGEAGIGKLAPPKTLYSHRKLLNAQELYDWASAAGIPNLVPPEEMHVTTIYSRQPVDIDPRANTVIAKRKIAPLGDKGALVLHFNSQQLQDEHRQAMAAGASHDWPSFLTHVTLSYGAGDQDFSGLEPPDFPLVFGPEIHAPINDNWAKDKGLR